MAASTATESYGTLLATSTDGSAYTTRSEITKISGPGIEFTEIDISHLASDNAFREFMSGMGNGGEVTFESNWIKSELNALYALVRTTIYWKITFPTASTWVLRGFISKFGTEIPLDDKISQSITVKVTGKPTFTV